MGGEWVALVGIGVGRLCQFDGGAGAGVCLKGSAKLVCVAVSVLASMEGDQMSAYDEADG